MSQIVNDSVHGHAFEVHPHEGAKKDISKVFWILLGITVFEVAIAFSGISKIILQTIFITLTLVKSFYIVFHFMHLNHEKKFLRAIILVPFLFIIYLIAISLKEGTAVSQLTNFLK